MNHINSASRILSLLKKVHAHKDTDKTSEVWAEIFEINEKNQNKKIMEITRCLSLMHDEIELIQENMKLSELDEFQCNGLLNSIFNVLSVQAIMGQCNSIKQHLTREVFLCLGYCRQVLPTEEEIVNEKDIEEIFNLISTLESQLESSTLPNFTKKMIRGHINEILKALHNYKILGASSLQGAMNTVVGEIIVNEEIIKDAKSSKEISTLGKILRKVSTVTEDAVKTEKTISSGVKITNYSTKVIEFIEGMI